MGKYTPPTDSESAPCAAELTAAIQNSHGVISRMKYYETNCQIIYNVKRNRRQRGYRMAEQIFIVEDGTLTKFESDDYVEEVYVPDCVKRIGCRAFYEAPVGKVVISDGVTVIEAEAFLDCGLNEIEIPDSVTTIKTWAFSGCEALREITIPESVTSIGSWAIGYREDQFRPWLDPIPFGRPVIIYGKPGSEAERYTKDNHWCFNEHITEFREHRTDDK